MCFLFWAPSVAAEAAAIAFGVLLSGSGSVWMSEFKLEPVDESDSWEPEMLKQLGEEDAPPGGA